MRIARHLAFACLLAGLLQQAAVAVTPLPSADGQFWDVQDTSPWAQDSGSIATGGRAHPFNGFGSLKLQVPATGFGHGTALSPELQAALPAARDLLRQWLSGHA